MLYLSWRQMMAKKKQTLLILLGISFASMLYVSIAGIQLGFREYITDQLLNNTAHILISGAESYIDQKTVTNEMYGEDAVIRWFIPPYGRRDESRLEDYPGWFDRLVNDPQVYDFSPKLSANVILTKGKFKASANLVGSIPERQVRVTSVEEYMKEGSFLNLRGGANKIILGTQIAKNLGVRVNDIINVNAGTKEVQPFKVVGLVHFGNQQMDEAVAFAHLINVQSLNKTPGRVSEIAVSLIDIEQATETADLWQLMSKDKVEDWKEANKNFMEMIKMQDVVRYFILSAILLVAAFGIYNILTIMINQKKREIAILRSIGYGPRRILELILYQGIMLGFSGGLLGIFTGYLICKWVESIDLGIEIGKSKGLLVSYDLSIYLTGFIAANIAALLASLLPAREASLMTPMDIIRSE